MVETDIDMLARVRNRIYADFLMRSRLDDYRSLLETALRAGYKIISVEHAWRLIRGGGLDPQQRHFVLRHDVDTDPWTAGAMWDIDRGLGVRSSYFFRLSTMAPPLMVDIAAGGGEASYHYEELTAVAKRRGLRSHADVLAHVPEAQDDFARNLERLRATTGLSMRVVASHGDFAGRRLGFSNWVILAEPDFRVSVDIDLETYDEAYLRHLPSRHSDAPYPRYWAWNDPSVAIQAGKPVISVLVHSRHWRVNRRANARDDIRRAVEGLRFELGGRPGIRA